MDLSREMALRVVSVYDGIAVVVALCVCYRVYMLLVQLSVLHMCIYA